VPNFGALNVPVSGLYLLASCSRRAPGVIVSDPTLGAAHMPTPLQLSDEDMDLLLTLAKPIDQQLRPQFLREVAQELEASGQAGGLGIVHRVGRVVQRRFWDPPQLPNASKAARA
jgi:hypothetical protein